MPFPLHRTLAGLASVQAGPVPQAAPIPLLKLDARLSPGLQSLPFAASSARTRHGRSGHGGCDKKRQGYDASPGSLPHGSLLLSCVRRCRVSMEQSGCQRGENEKSLVLPACCPKGSVPSDRSSDAGFALARAALAPCEPEAARRPPPQAHHTDFPAEAGARTASKSVLLDPVLERPQGDPQDPRRLLPVPADFLKHLLDGLTLHSRQKAGR